MLLVGVVGVGFGLYMMACLPGFLMLQPPRTILVKVARDSTIEIPVLLIIGVVSWSSIVVVVSLAAICIKAMANSGTKWKRVWGRRLNVGNGIAAPSCYHIVEHIGHPAKTMVIEAIDTDTALVVGCIELVVCYG